MINYIVYNKFTGHIIKTGSCTISQLYIQAIEEWQSFALDSANDETDYYDLTTEEVKPRELNTTIIDKTEISANGIDIATMSNIPNGSDVYINNEFILKCYDGVFEFSTDTISPHTITIKKVEFLDYQVTINAV